MSNKNAVSYETALKLKEAGLEVETERFIDPDGLLYWKLYHNDHKLFVYVELSLFKGYHVCSLCPDIIPAPTLDELLDVLPKTIQPINLIYSLVINFNKNTIGYEVADLAFKGVPIIDNNRKEAAAQMVLKAVKEGWIK
jgi:hypothetical protein